MGSHLVLFDSCLGLSHNYKHKNEYELEILQSYVGIGDVACSCGLILRCQLGRLKTFSLYVTLSFPSSLSLYEITHTLSLSEKAQLYLCDFDHYKILFALAVMVIRL